MTVAGFLTGTMIKVDVNFYGDSGTPIRVLEALAGSLFLVLMLFIISRHKLTLFRRNGLNVLVAVPLWFLLSILPAPGIQDFCDHLLSTDAGSVAWTFAIVLTNVIVLTSLTLVPLARARKLRLILFVAYGAFVCLSATWATTKSTNAQDRAYYLWFAPVIFVAVFVFAASRIERGRTQQTHI